MPWIVCPVCQSCSMRQAWRRADGTSIPFGVVCPYCAVDSDIADVAMRLRPPDGALEDMRAAALARRVSRALAA